MEDLLKAGKAKSIGVSNFSQKKLEEEILPYATVVPAVDQVGPLETIFVDFSRVLTRGSIVSVLWFNSSSSTCTILIINSWNT